LIGPLDATASGLTLDLLDLAGHRAGQGLRGGQRPDHDRELVDQAVTGILEQFTRITA
jgi:hypothetical protein